MTQIILNLDALLGLDKYVIDDKQSHILVDQERCQACAARPCLTVCPAQVYQWTDGHLTVRYENCLECGTCQIACDHDGKGGIIWRNPVGGFGIQYRYG